MFDYLIVGAGFAGSVLAERLANGSGKRVMICDKRPHIGGNAYDFYNDDGILIHKYGPHIFHTNSADVFEYLSRFTEWRDYQHRVLAEVDGMRVPIPINLDTINKLYGLKLNAHELQEFFDKVRERRQPVKTSEDVVVNAVGRELYEKFFRGYTRKQWGLDPSELDASVTARVPTRTNRDDRYFTDTFQAMPKHGYTRMFEKMLDNPNITIVLNSDYKELQKEVAFREMIYTGPVDAFFDYRYGKLPYRSLEFKHETHDVEVFQEAPGRELSERAAVHACNGVQISHRPGSQEDRCGLRISAGEGDPYYPIPRPENAELYKQYEKLAEARTDVHFVGRLATYKYYNMDQIVAQALTVYGKIEGLKRKEAAKVKIAVPTMVYAATNGNGKSNGVSNLDTGFVAVYTVFENSRLRRIGQ
jgi:UDP-galactopyranose mutase